MEDGGLGILGREQRNVSLLAKWTWWFHLEKEALWHRVIESKYSSTHFDSGRIPKPYTLPEVHSLKEWYMLQHLSPRLDHLSFKKDTSTHSESWMIHL